MFNLWKGSSFSSLWKDFLCRLTHLAAEAVFLGYDAVITNYTWYNQIWVMSKDQDDDADNLQELTLIFWLGDTWSFNLCDSVLVSCDMVKSLSVLTASCESAKVVITLENPNDFLGMKLNVIKKA